MSCVRAIQSDHPFELDAYVILPDHLHMIWSLPEHDSNYPMRWRLIKAAFSRHAACDQIQPSSESRTSKGERSIWQRRYWEHTIAGESDYTAHVEYIHFNPVKHSLAKAPCDWPHSSFHDWVARGHYDRNWGSDETELTTLVAPE